MRAGALIQIAKDTIGNVFSRKRLVFVTEPRWVVDAVWRSMANALEPNTPVSTTTSRYLLRNKIINFGSVNTLVGGSRIRNIHPSNKAVLTWYHVEPLDQRLKHLEELSRTCSLLLTSCTITRTQLAQKGFPEERIVIVPLGIDNKLFRPATVAKRKRMRRKLKLPESAVVVGSFQKDGVGWGEGLEPKLVKGPDLFCEAVSLLARNHKVHVLLTGPSRGYVMRRLANENIPFTHTNLKRHEEVASMYHALDLYLVTARAEGGPMAILESLASGVPLVTTNVGMAPDILTHGKDALICDVEDTDCIVKSAERIIKDKSLRDKLAKNGQATAQKYSWGSVAEQYRQRIVERIMDEDTHLART